MKIRNGTNCTNDNEVNKIPEYNLLHNIINRSKRIKIYNHYSLILHGYMNTLKYRNLFLFFNPFGYLI